MDSDFSHSSLVILIIGIQGLILGLVGLFLFYRKFSPSSKSESRIKTFLAQHTRRTAFFGGILMGVIFIGISIYFVGALGRSRHPKPASPISKPSFSPQLELSPYEKNEPVEQSSSRKATPLWNSEIKYGDSRMRETTRKTIQGELPDSPKGKRPPNPALHSYLRLINGWLEEENLPGGQPHDAKLFFNRLVKEYGFRGSETTVKGFLKQRSRDQTSELDSIFLVDSSCGQQAEVHWDSVDMVLSGTEVSLYLFSMQSKWSEKCFVYCCSDTQLDAFFDAHIRAFEFFGGIFPNIVYLTLPEAVESELRNTHSAEHDRFARFCAYYNISPKFREPDQGRENGNTKGCLHDILHKPMVSDSAAETLEELNRTLLAECMATGDHPRKGHSRTINDLFMQEKICLLAFPKVPPVPPEIQPQSAGAGKRG
jgi:transposase